VTVAKRDLKAGEQLDGIGGFYAYGLIDNTITARADDALPIGRRKAVYYDEIWRRTTSSRSRMWSHGLAGWSKRSGGNRTRYGPLQREGRRRHRSSMCRWEGCKEANVVLQPSTV
jgi:hypothetical protein